MKKVTTIVFVLSLSATVVRAQAPADSTTTANDSILWSSDMKGVTIKAQRQLIKQEIDRVGYDVQADEESKTLTVMDMLRKVPMVTIDGEDNILIRGNSNYKIYKNGHLDPNLTRNAKEVLKAMPASAVKRIEVITEPGAREDAEGVNAILNIVMMDNRRMEGVTGSVNGSYSTLNNPAIGGYLTTQMGKAIMSVDYGYNNMSKRETENSNIVERTFVGSGNTQHINSNGKNPGNLHYIDFNASYDIDTLNLLSASFGGYFYKVNVQGTTTTSMFDATNALLYQYDDRYWLPDYNHHSWNGRLDYEHKTHRKGEQFTLSYMFALTRQHSDQEDVYTNIVNAPFNYSGMLIHSREHFTEHTFQADYVRPLWEGHKLEVGIKYIDRRNKSENSQDYYGASLPAINTAFNHSTQIAATYADYLYTKGKWSARAGLRYEYSYLKGRYPDNAIADFHKHLHDYVPQASMKYQIDDRQSLKFGYTTSITRPGITYLNPSVVSTPTRVDFGNAHLVSTRQQTLALTYMYVGQRLTLQFVPHYSYYHNGIASLIYSQGDRVYSTWSNNLRQHRWQLEGYVQWKPFDGTTVVANINLVDNHAKDSASGIKQHLTSMFYYANIAQKLPWKLLFTAYAYGLFGHSPMNIYSYSSPYHRYAFTLQRSFLKEDRLTVRLTANTPFHKKVHDKSHTTQGDILGWSDAKSVTNARYFKVSVSYRFGKLKASVKKTDTSIENDDIVGGITRGR